MPTPELETWKNSLGMRFVPLGPGLRISIWETRVMDYDIFAETAGYDADHKWRTLELEGNFTQGPTHPVVWVPWNDAVAFCRWLTTKELEAGVITNAMYRLPTDLEWSRAVGLPLEDGATPKERSGRIPNVFPYGTHYPPKRNEANYWYMTDGYDYYFYTSPVGRFPPTGPYHLYDMGGNVWEWCQDPYDPSSLEDSGWVIRGGGYFTASRDHITSSYRGDLGEWSRDIGFRVVLSAPEP